MPALGSQNRIRIRKKEGGQEIKLTHSHAETRVQTHYHFGNINVTNLSTPGEPGELVEVIMSQKNTKQQKNSCKTENS